MPKRKGRGRILRVATEHTVLIVPSKTKKYRRVLFVMDFVITGFGLTFFCLAIAMIFSDLSTVLPDWTFIWLLVIGGTTVVLGVFSGHGSHVAKKKIERGRWNCWLVFVALVCSILILAELTLGIWAIGEAKLIDNELLAEGTSFLSDFFQETIENMARARPTAWWDWQKVGNCCGWQNNTIPDPLATGKFCTADMATSAESCVDVFMDAFQSSYFILIGIALFFIAEVMVCVSSTCLACWIQAEEPYYA